MKTQYLSQPTVKIANLSLACLAFAAFAGCQSTNYVRSDATAGLLQTTAIEIRAASSNLDVTITALNDLLTNPAGDLRIQYATFSLDLDRLAVACNRASAEASGLQRHSAAYFA